MQALTNERKGELGDTPYRPLPSVSSVVAEYRPQQDNNSCSPCYALDIGYPTLYDKSQQFGRDTAR